MHQEKPCHHKKKTQKKNTKKNQNSNENLSTRVQNDVIVSNLNFVLGPTMRKPHTVYSDIKKPAS